MYIGTWEHCSFVAAVKSKFIICHNLSFFVAYYIIDTGSIFVANVKYFVHFMEHLTLIKMEISEELCDAYDSVNRKKTHKTMAFRRFVCHSLEHFSFCYFIYWFYLIILNIHSSLPISCACPFVYLFFFICVLITNKVSKIKNSNSFDVFFVVKFNSWLITAQNWKIIELSFNRNFRIKAILQWHY